MSPVSERVSDASPPDWEGRVARSLALAAIARLQAGQSGVSPRLDQRVAPSLAMSTDAAAERGSQPAQRDELAHSHLVPILWRGFTSHKRYPTYGDYDVRGFSSHSTL